MNLLHATATRGRKQAEARFTEAFEFFTETDGVDPVTLNPTVTVTVLADDIPGRVKFPKREAGTPEVAGQVPVVTGLEVHVGVGSFAATPNTLVKVTDSTIDTELIGRVYRVTDSPVMGSVTAWRTPVEDTGRIEDVS